MDQIIDTVEESLMPLSCMNVDGTCSRGTECATQSVWHGLGKQIRSFLASVSLEDLTDDCRQQSSCRVANC